MNMHPKITPEIILEAVQADDNLGFCVECGMEAQCVEPDARRYKCESCGEFAVYGAPELMMRLAF